MCQIGMCQTDVCVLKPTVAFCEQNTYKFFGIFCSFPSAYMSKSTFAVDHPFWIATACKKGVAELIKLQLRGWKEHRSCTATPACVAVAVCGYMRQGNVDAARSVYTDFENVLPNSTKNALWMAMCAEERLVDDTGRRGESVLPWERIAATLPIWGMEGVNQFQFNEATPWKDDDDFVAMGEYERRLLAKRGVSNHMWRKFVDREWFWRAFPFLASASAVGWVAVKG